MLSNHRRKIDFFQFFLQKPDFYKKFLSSLSTFFYLSDAFVDYYYFENFHNSIFYRTQSSRVFYNEEKIQNQF